MDDFFNVVSGPQFIISIIIVIAAFVLWVCVRIAHKKYMAKNKSRGEKATLVRVMFGILRFMIIAGTLLTVLQINGINVTSAIAGLGLLSAIIGLAIQDALKDAIMGIHIMSDHFFSVGDVVKYGDIEGVVTGFTMKSTTLRNIIDGTVTTVCNRNISEITRMPSSSITDIDLPIPYEEDFEKVNNVLTEICKKIENADGFDACTYEGTQKFDSSAILYRIRFYCSPEFKPDRTRDALKIIQEELLKFGISTAYNRLDIHNC